MDAIQFWWIFDALVVLIAVWVIFSNGRRGVNKVLVLSIGYLIATVAASFGATIAAPVMYELYARDSNLAAIQEVNKEFDTAKCFCEALDEQHYGTEIEQGRIQALLLPPNTDDFDQNIFAYINEKCGGEVATPMAFKKVLSDAFMEDYGKTLGEKLPYYAEVNFKDAMSKDPALIHTMLTEFYSIAATDKDKAEFVEDRFVKESTVQIFTIFIYLVIFSVIMVIAAVIAKGVQYSLFINISAAKDHLYGAVLGLIEAAVMLILLTLFVRLLVLLFGGRLLCFNEETIYASRIFKYLYERIDLLL